MKIGELKSRYSLCDETVDRVSEEVRAYLLAAGADRQMAERIRLTVEELLLEYMENGFAGQNIEVGSYSRLGRRYLTMRVEGESYDPFHNKTEENGGYGEGILRTIGLAPEYTREAGANLFRFRVKKKQRSPLILFGVSILAALILGSAGLLLPAGFRDAVTGVLLDRLYNAFLDTLGLAAGPMIFLSVAWGIYGIGDTATLSTIGKKMILRFFRIDFGVLLIAGCALLPFFALHFGGGSSIGSSFSDILTMLFGIIPKNIFSPFIEGNTLQIIFLAFIIGIAMLFLGKQTSAVAKAVEQINYIVGFLMEFITSLVPYFIFIVVVRFIWSGTLGTLSGLTRMLLLFIGAVLIMTMLLILLTARKNRVSPILLIRKGLPTFLVAITTASSAASFGTNKTACEKRFGVDPALTGFGIPLGMVACKPMTAINYLVFALFFAEKYGVECSASWLVMAFLTTGILCVATPPIPGGALTAYTVIFTQLGIPLEALSMALAADVVADFVDTGFDQFILPIPLINQAGAVGRLNTEVLRKK